MIQWTITKNKIYPEFCNFCHKTIIPTLHLRYIVGSSVNLQIPEHEITQKLPFVGPTETNLTLLTLNVETYNTCKQNGQCQQLADQMIATQVDVICLQEDLDILFN